MTRNNHATPIEESLLLTPQEAVEAYTKAGGSITEVSQFGVDPLVSSPTLGAQRESKLLEKHNYMNVFHKLVNGDAIPFMAALVDLINISETLAVS